MLVLEGKSVGVLERADDVAEDVLGLQELVTYVRPITKDIMKGRRVLLTFYFFFVSLSSLFLFFFQGLKGLCAYAHHASELGQESSELYTFVEEVSLLDTFSCFSLSIFLTYSSFLIFSPSFCSLTGPLFLDETRSERLEQRPPVRPRRWQTQLEGDGAPRRRTHDTLRSSRAHSGREPLLLCFFC